MVAVFVAYFATRLRDIYFSITTLVFSQIFYVIIFTWTEVTGGENGLTFRQPPFAIPGLCSRALHARHAALVRARRGRRSPTWLLRRITQSPFGKVLQSIRENEPRTRAIGYSIERYKIVAVMLSGLFAGLAGVLYAIQNKFAAPDFVFFVVSGEVVIFNVMGGMGTLVGPVAGAAFFFLLREGFSRFFTEYYLIPGRHHLHRHGHLHPPGPPRLPQAPPERLAAPARAFARCIGFATLTAGRPPPTLDAMLARIRSAGIHGIQARSVWVEVDVTSGLPSFSTVGLPDSDRAREPGPDPRRHPQLGLPVSPWSGSRSASRRPTSARKARPSISRWRWASSPPPAS